ncbi:MAG: MBL fold metallo-hydrolase [Deltaproteobacteria bacterium]|nr:MBL fold metallo-hydrolase [Deltaproteobacteria bacterium]
MKIADDIYVYEWTNIFENNCNSYYVGGSVKALIDPGLSLHVPDLLTRMEGDSIDPADIRFIINTHSHPDHFEGNLLFSHREDLLIALHENEFSYHRSEGKVLYDLFGLPFPEVAVDLLLKEGSLVMGEESFEIHHLPGHSPGSVGLAWPARKIIFCGDVIFRGNVGRTDFPGGNDSLLKSSIEKIAGLDIDCLCPGHMDVIEGNENVRNNFRMIMNSIFPYL